MALANPAVRSLHDLGLAAWFGGSFMAIVGLHGAAEEVDDPRQRARVPSGGWNRWAPIQNTGIATHLVAAALLTRANRGRLVAQRGVTSLGVAKAIVTALAAGATAVNAVMGAAAAEGGRPGHRAPVPSRPLGPHRAARGAGHAPAPTGSRAGGASPVPTGSTCRP